MHVCSCAHLCLSSDVIRVRVISSPSLLIVQPNISKTNVSYLILYIKYKLWLVFVIEDFIFYTCVPDLKFRMKKWEESSLTFFIAISICNICQSII